MHRIERRRHILFTWRIEILEMYSKKCFLHLLQFQYLIPYNNASNVFQPIYVQNPAQSLIESIHHNSDNLRMYVCMYVYLALNGYNKEKEKFFYNWYNFL